MNCARLSLFSDLSSLFRNSENCRADARRGASWPAKTRGGEPRELWTPMDGLPLLDEVGAEPTRRRPWTWATGFEALGLANTLPCSASQRWTRKSCPEPLSFKILLSALETRCIDWITRSSRPDFQSERLRLVRKAPRRISIASGCFYPCRAICFMPGFRSFFLGSPENQVSFIVARARS